MPKNFDILYRIYLLSRQKFILELASYFVEVKIRKTTSAKRQTTADRTNAFAIYRQSMLSFHWRNFPYEIAKYIAAFTGLEINYTKAQGLINTRSSKRNYQR